MKSIPHLLPLPPKKGKKYLKSPTCNKELFTNILKSLSGKSILPPKTSMICYPVMIYYNYVLGFPGGSGSKESTSNVADLGSISGLEISLAEGHGNPLQYSCLANPHGQRSLAGYTWWGWKESDTSEWHSTAVILNQEWICTASSWGPLGQGMEVCSTVPVGEPAIPFLSHLIWLRRANLQPTYSPPQAPLPLLSSPPFLMECVSAQWILW